MNGLQIDLTRDDTIALVGRLDGRSAATARAVLQDIVDGLDVDAMVAGGERLVVDLANLEIWDRAGLGVMVGLARRATGRGVALVLTNAGAREQRLLRVAGVGRMARMTTCVPQQNRGPYRAETRLGA